MGQTIPVPTINNVTNTNSIIFPPDNICVKIDFTTPINKV